jgi:pimeloyl-ACP methyl ester carboxylesterase
MITITRFFLFSLMLAFVSSINIPVDAQDISPDEPEPLGIALENYEYPFPVHYMSLQIQGKDVRMAYMDVTPSETPNGRTVVLMHGKNFFGAYWEDTIRVLADLGYRVVVPDQIGFGKSSKPEIRYSFHQMGDHTRKLLDKLEIENVAVGGHSMGGMVAARFALMYPDLVSHLFLENPIGLEDYRRKASWIPVEQMYEGVLNLQKESIRAQHEAYYVEWKPEYEEYIQVHYRWTLSGDYPRFAKVSALTSQMIYEQPVIHEFPDIEVPTLLIIGQEDRTAPGRNRAEPDVAEQMGYYPDLGRRADRMIPNSTLVELHNVGHTPHFEAFDDFIEALTEFLEE